MRFLIIGRGNVGRKHEKILRDMSHEVITLDIDSATGADFQHLSSVNMAFRRFDGVLICTPPHVRQFAHLPQSYHYFIEKPLGKFSLPAGATCQVGFCYNYLPSLRAFVKKLSNYRIHSASLVGGQPLQDWHEEDYRQVSQHYHGVVTDSLPHSLYIARWILGELELIGNVVAHSSDLEINHEDTAAVLLHAESGASCYLLADYLRDPRAFKIEAVTNDGVRNWEFAPEEAPEMYVKQMEHFCQICTRKIPEIMGYPDIEDGQAVQKLLDKVT